MSVEPSASRRIYGRTTVQGQARAILGDSHTHHHYYGSLAQSRPSSDGIYADYVHNSDAAGPVLNNLRIRALMLRSHCLSARDTSQPHLGLRCRARALATNRNPRTWHLSMDIRCPTVQNMEVRYWSTCIILYGVRCVIYDVYCGSCS